MPDVLQEKGKIRLTIINWIMRNKMKEETFSEKINRHKKEGKKQIEGWEAELEFVKKKEGTEYQKYQEYCKFMIEVWKNTLKKLEELEIM